MKEEAPAVGLSGNEEELARVGWTGFGGGSPGKPNGASEADEPVKKHREWLIKRSGLGASLFSSKFSHQISCGTTRWIFRPRTFERSRTRHSSNEG